MEREGRRSRQRRGGFTLAELLISMVVGSIVVAAIASVLVGQNRLFWKQREIRDVRTTLRVAGNLLAFEFRQLSPESGDLYRISPNSVVLRSNHGVGVICAAHPKGRQFGLISTFGEFSAMAGDSLLIYNSPKAEWVVAKVESISPKGKATKTCVWGKAKQPSDLSLLVEAGPATEAIGVGAPVRLFRRTEYRILQTEGRWWLGRAVASVRPLEIIAGPLRPPEEGGLAFAYFDVDGNPTSDPSQVRYVDITLRGESLGVAPAGRGRVNYQEDEIIVRAAPRG